MAVGRLAWLSAEYPGGITVAQIQEFLEHCDVDSDRPVEARLDRVTGRITQLVIPDGE